MTGPCRQFAEALAVGDPAVEALRKHAAGCPECGPRLALWDGIEASGPGLRRSWESGDLLPRIVSALALEEQKARGSDARPAGRFHWIPLVSAAALFVIATVGLQVFRNAGGREPLVNTTAVREPLLSDRALQDVETSEEGYVRSIDHLSELARPQIEHPTTPLLVNYREKLFVLDSAISEMRGQIESNRFNSHLRRELLAMYQEKQRTLQELMKEAKS